MPFVTILDSAVEPGLAVPVLVVRREAVGASLLARNDRQSFRSGQPFELFASMEHMTFFVTNGAHLHPEVVYRKARVQFLRF